MTKLANLKIEVVVTRHPGLVEYLKQEGILTGDERVISHAAPEDVRGKNVLGVLPHSLSCLTRTFTEVPLRLTPELRGKELTASDIRKIAGEPVTYVVCTLPDYIERIDNANLEGTVGHAPKYLY